MDRDACLGPIFAGYEWTREWEKREKPDVIILGYNDHASAFDMKIMPTFAIGCGECHRPANESWGPREVPDVIGDPDLADALVLPEVNAVILCTPTQLHAAQAITCMDAGKPVQIEIPLCDSWPDAQAIVARQQETGLVCIDGHTRRFNPSHQWVHNRVVAGGLALQQMDVQTCFFRRKNMNPKGEPRSWTDHLLWYYAAHATDLTGVAVSNNGIELQDREFVSAIREGREPNSSFAQVLDCYRVIGELAEQLEAQDGWS